MEREREREGGKGKKRREHVGESTRERACWQVM